MPRSETPIRPILVTENEAAKVLGFSPRTLQSWRVSGDGPPFVRVSPRAIRYRLSDLEAWIETCLKQSTSEYDHVS